MESVKRTYYNIEDVSIEDVLHAHGIELKNGMFSIRNEKTPFAKYYPLTNSYYDFGENVGGDAVTLAQQLCRLESREEGYYYLSNLFGLPSLNWEIEGETGLSDHQYARIGIQADLATKNLEFGIEDYGTETAEEFSVKYNMTVQQLAKRYPIVYHNMLRKRSVPLLYEKRSQYYFELFSKDQLLKAVGVNVLECPEVLKESEVIQKRMKKIERTLRKAIQNKELLRFKRCTYDVKKDIEKIRSGAISFEIGNISYAQLKREARLTGIELKHVRMDYFKFLDVQKQVSNTAAVVKKDKVNVICDSKIHQQVLAIAGKNEVAQQRVAAK